MSKLAKEYLFYTFLIMIVCWGIFLWCSVSGINIEDKYIKTIFYKWINIKSPSYVHETHLLIIILHNVGSIIK